MDLRRLGAVLRKQRETAGMPAAEVARRVRVSPTYIWMVENARPRKSGEPSRPSEDVLRRWASVLRMDERYLRQVLRLAGYVEESPAPRGPMPRMMTRMAASPSPGTPMMNALFAAPEPSPAATDLRTDVLAEALRELLALARESDRLEETADLLESYLAFLRYRLEGNEPGEDD